MSENCNHNCSSCGKSCSERKAESFLVPQNDKSNIKKVIAVVSGKGGVGKSMVTSMLSILSERAGNKTAIIDADITGPSIAKTFGVQEETAYEQEGYLLPVSSSKGIKLMSLDFLTDDPTRPVIWRGPVIAATVKQFWAEVAWGDVDMMFVDCPPGTGDVPLTLFQSLPISGIVVVTSPQELVSTIVGKAVNMAKKMNIPILGIVENFSYFICDSCDKKHYIYGESNLEKIAEEYGIKNIARMPIDPKLREKVDEGMLEAFEGDWLNDLFSVI